MDTTRDRPTTATSSTNPRWWNEKHTSAWDRVKDALKRDWEQTKADFSKEKGHELNQNVADTVKQSAGSEPIPPGNVPNTKATDYKTAEPGLRYGHGASMQYADHHEWDATLEGKLRKDWDDLKSGGDWDAMKGYVRRGW